MRAFVKIIITFFLVLILILAALPVVLSTHKGNQIALALVNQFINGKVEADSFKFSWLGSQEAHNFIFKDTNGKIIVQFKKFSTQTSLLSRLLKIRNIGETHLQDFSIFIALQDKEEIEQGEKKISRKERPPKLSGPILLENGTLIIEKKGALATTLQNIQLNINPRNEEFHLQADATQGGHNGTLVATGNYGSNKKINAKLTNFPLTPLELTQNFAWVPDALGPELSSEIHLQQENENDTLLFTLNLKSTNLQATIEGQGNGSTFQFSPESTIDFTLTPTFFNQWFNLNDDTPLFLADKSTLSLNLNKLELPLNHTKHILKDLDLELSFSTSSITMIYNKKAYLFEGIKGLVTQRDNLFTINYDAEMRTQKQTRISGNAVRSSKEEWSFSSNIEKVPSILLDALLGEKGGVSTLGEELSITLNGRSTPSYIQLDFTIDSNRAHLLGNIKGKNLNRLIYSVQGSLQFEEKEARTWGEKLAISLQGVLSFSENTFAFGTIQGKANNEFIHIDLRGKLGEKGKAFSWDLVDIVLSGSVDGTPLFKNNDLSELQKSYPFYVHLEGSDNELLFNVDLKVLKINGNIKGFIKEGALAFREAEWTIYASGREMPIALVSAIIPKFHALPDLIGDYLTFTADMQHTTQREPRTVINVKAAGDGIDLSASLNMDGTIIVGEEGMPAHIHYELTPKRYKALMSYFNKENLPPFVLSKTSSCDLTISQLICPKTKDQNFLTVLCKSGFSGSLKISSLTFANSGAHQIITIDEINASIHGEDFSQAVAFELETLIHTPFDKNDKIAPLSIKGELLHLFTHEGGIDFTQAELKGELNIDQFSVAGLTGIIPFDEQTRKLVQAFLGEIVHIKAAIDIKQNEGEITLNINSSNLKVNCPFFLTKSHTLVLRESLDAEILLSDAINETLIKDINPIFVAGVYSDHPLRLHIDATGFSMPIFPFNFRGVTIQSAYVDIGKIEVVNGDEIQKIMDFLKAKEISQERVMTAWFTPIYFHLSNGTVEYERFDLLLASNIHLAFWGRIDLIKDKVRMTLGISPRTLQQSFGIKGLTATQMFQIKMRGRTSNVELDWNAAKGRLGVILASSAVGQIPIVGGILGEAISNLGEKPTPTPTTQPLPWEK